MKSAVSTSSWLNCASNSTRRESRIPIRRFACSSYLDKMVFHVAGCVQNSFTQKLQERQQLLQAIADARSALTSISQQTTSAAENLASVDADRAGAQKDLSALSAEQARLKAQNGHSNDEISTLREILQALTTDKYKLQPALDNANSVSWLVVQRK
jgi:predicted  nucleic acid-binding Zn-ribbon protein